MAKYNHVKIHEIIEKYCRDEEDLDPKIAYDVAFHMTDWMGDLEKLVEFYEKPTELSPEQLKNLLYGFLYHVPHHVTAAAKLLLDVHVTDVFGVGVIDPDKAE
jgi:hypothetical protein